MASQVGYAAVRDMSQPLDAHSFELWWHTLTVYQQAQSKEGRDQLKLTRDSRLVAEQERAMADALDGVDVGDDADGTHTRLHARRRRVAYPDAPARDLADGARVPGALFTNPARLLQVLAPEDPRAIYVRAGGRLDAHGNPVPTGGAAGPASSTPGTRPGERSFDELQAAGWQPLAPGAPLDPLRPMPPGPPPAAAAAPSPAPPASFAALARAPSLPDNGPPGT